MLESEQTAYLRKETLMERQAAAQVKFDRCLAELERLGARRIGDLFEEIESFDVPALTSLVADIRGVQQQFLEAQKELRRIR